MQNKNHKLFQMPSRFVSRLLRVAGHQPAPSAPPEQLDLDLGLDHITHTSLRVRDALPVRSAELWLLMGNPDEALKELQTLSASALLHPWPHRVQLNAAQAAKAIAA
jgi:hypothetical protein